MGLVRSTATQFKARCLRLLDEVAETGEPLVTTKHGRPVARLEPPVRAAEGDCAISTISAQEIAFLVMCRRIELDRPVARWIGDVMRVHEVRALAPTVSIAVRAGSLDAETFSGDPADRLIYATAVEHGSRIASADRRLHAADPARVVW